MCVCVCMCVCMCVCVCVLCLASNRQRGHLETAPPFTVPCDGHEARLLHRSHRESNPGHRVVVHYTTA